MLASWIAVHSRHLELCKSCFPLVSASGFAAEDLVFCDGRVRKELLQGHWLVGTKMTCRSSLGICLLQEHFSLNNWRVAADDWDRHDGLEGTASLKLFIGAVMAQNGEGRLA